MVQSVLGMLVGAPSLDEELAGTAQEPVSLRLASPAGDGTELVERERLTSGTQDPEAAHGERLGRDALPQLHEQRREAAGDILDATLRRGELRGASAR